MEKPVILKDIRIVTVSGRIASGSTTLAKSLSHVLGWRHIEGGEVFWEALRTKLGLDPKDTNLRPDKADEDFDASLKRIFQDGSSLVVETKLAGFNAQDISGIFKILVLCENEQGADQTEIRIDRLINREHMTTQDAKEEVLVREQNDIEKWRRLYGNDDHNWTYVDHKYYDLVINTYSHNQEEAFKQALTALGIQQPTS